MYRRRDIGTLVLDSEGVRKENQGKGTPLPGRSFTSGSPSLEAAGESTGFPGPELSHQEVRLEAGRGWCSRQDTGLEQRFDGNQRADEGRTGELD